MGGLNHAHKDAPFPWYRDVDLNLRQVQALAVNVFAVADDNMSRNPELID